MQTVIFTGATSFLGKNLAKKLLEDGYKVYALIREKSTNCLLYTSPSPRD